MAHIWQYVGGGGGRELKGNSKPVADACNLLSKVSCLSVPLEKVICVLSFEVYKGAIMNDATQVWTIFTPPPSVTHFC